jgi:hypothetical protein
MVRLMENKLAMGRRNELKKIPLLHGEAWEFYPNGTMQLSKLIG